MKYSKQREVILEYLKSVSNHPTAEMVYNDIRENNPNISLGTVYRNLNKLSQCGMITRLKFANDKDRFDGETGHHYHGICTKCGNIEDIFVDYFFDIDKKIESKNSTLKVISHDIIFNIICSNCNKK